MNRGLILLSYLLIFASCNFNGSEKPKKFQEEARIYSLMIDELAVAYPLPPMPSKDSLESEIQNTNWDSIKKVKTTLVVDSVMYRTDTKISLPKEYQGFQKLCDKINTLSSKTLDINLINSEEGHKLIYGKSLDDFKGEYPQMVSISRIAFNDDFKNAALYAGQTTGKLSGFVNFYLLKKENGEWEIIYKKNVEVS